jgi:hypothetical protein
MITKYCNRILVTKGMHRLRLLQPFRVEASLITRKQSGALYLYFIKNEEIENCAPFISGSYLPLQNRMMIRARFATAHHIKQTRK